MSKYNIYNQLAIEAKGGNFDSEEKLLDLMRPQIFHSIRKYNKNSALTTDYLQLEAHEQIGKAIERFDPDKGANFQTFAGPYINKMRRRIYEHANVGYIPEHRIIKVKQFQQVYEALKGRLRREPSQYELSDELGWGINEVSRMTRELKKDMIIQDDVTGLPESDQNTLTYIYFELDREEQPVFERLVGLFGRRKMSAHEIAADMGITTEQVYSMKKRITRKMDPIIRGM